ncbi:Protein of unknown function [Methylobacterium phyllostachyos]|uniref:DUF1826 domain-containing protein n=1 Tax=Methylobacterium phyllostachyos TaxID=582672 RepID=A0A1H0L4V3_9HYPH|nr:DUF1826 domain-containing protein [Methylobacterium phyllostachyos]SDO63033.1 Protein of unknown function [Methylobacterium phyllostachyos]
MHVREVDSVEGLAIVRRPGINLAFLPRALPVEVVAHLPAMVSAGLAPVRCEAPHDAIEAELRHRLPPGPSRDWLAADAARLARTLAQLTGTRRVVLRIEAIAGDGCRLFHADAVALRLVTTYEGRGTQWLADADADTYGNGGDVPEDHIHEVATGTVAVFRGLRGVTGGHPLVHRSPPRRPGDCVRLFLAVDPATH